MGILIEIPAATWGDVLPRFSKRNQGRPTKLETTVQPGEGVPLLAEHQQLLGLNLVSKGSEAPAIAVTLGGLDLETPSFIHVIKGPTHVWVDEDMPGFALAVEIDSLDEGRTILVFERQSALPWRTVETAGETIRSESDAVAPAPNNQA